MSEELSIEQAAEQLGVSTATVRRRVKKGELQAIKKPGPYGDQYYIPSSEISTAQNITDVVPVVRQFNAQELAGFISLAIRRENEDLHQEIKELRQELAKFKQDQEEKAQDRDDRIVAQIRNLMEQKKQPWWTRLFG
jgi:excisionase family DNA binding protein